MQAAWKQEGYPLSYPRSFFFKFFTKMNLGYQNVIGILTHYWSFWIYIYSTVVDWIYRWTRVCVPSPFSRLASFENWTTKDIPSQEGKIALVTGATSGLGFQTALALAQAGATVIVGGRYDDEVSTAVQKIRQICPSAKLEFGNVDHCSLDEVADFAASLIAKYPCLDILVNNAGIYSPEKRQVTADGFEAIFQTNYLSHFALTAQLLPLLRKSSSSPRVVHVSSLAQHFGDTNLRDLQSQKSYGWLWGFSVYAQSKLANMLFALELQRQSDEGGWGIVSIAAHPGIAATPMSTNIHDGKGWFSWMVKNIANPIVSHSSANGALPQIFAATSIAAKARGYYGPSGIFEFKGYIAPAYISQGARNKKVAAELWDTSCKLANVSWPISKEKSN